jgi:hypothetical protein
MCSLPIAPALRNAVPAILGPGNPWHIPEYLSMFLSLSSQGLLYLLALTHDGKQVSALRVEIVGGSLRCVPCSVLVMLVAALHSLCCFSQVLAVHLSLAVMLPSYLVMASKLTFDRPPTLVTTGRTSSASTLSYLDNGVVFVGSRQGDSQLIRLHPQPPNPQDPGARGRWGCGASGTSLSCLVDCMQCYPS